MWRIMHRLTQSFASSDVHETVEILDRLGLEKLDLFQISCDSPQVSAPPQALSLVLVFNGVRHDRFGKAIRVLAAAEVPVSVLRASIDCYTDLV